MTQRPERMPRCQEPPRLEEVEPGHSASCWLYGDERSVEVQMGVPERIELPMSEDVVGGHAGEETALA